MNDQSENNDLKSVTEGLYKQNLELTVKNKILSLLRKLYEMSIQTLGHQELSEGINKMIQQDLSFELVGIFIYQENEDCLLPISFAESERLHEVNSNHSLRLEQLPIKEASKNIFLKRIIGEKEVAYTEKIEDVWGALIPEETYMVVKSDGHIKSSILLPLIIGGKVIGILMLSLNRDYEHLAEYEKESIRSFGNVIAVALDKSLLYEEMIRANQELGIANNKLKELDQMKSEFLSLATHQIRSPLTAIKGYSSMLLEGDFGVLPEKAKEAANIVLISSQNLINIVGDFLDISRIEQGRMVYNKSIFEVTDLLLEVTNSIKPNIVNAGLTIDLDIGNNDSTKINADRDKIKQVVGNIIDNATKYTLKGGIVISIKLSGSKVLILIKDTGVGIDPAEMSKLFNKFSRTKDANKTNVIGTGLGLYIAKKMIEAHNGDIKVASEGLGKGTTFTIELPRYQ